MNQRGGTMYVRDRDEPDLDFCLAPPLIVTLRTPGGRGLGEGGGRKTLYASASNSKMKS